MVLIYGFSSNSALVTKCNALGSEFQATAMFAFILLTRKILGTKLGLFGLIARQRASRD